MKTLKEYMTQNNPDYIQLIFGDFHIVNIDTNLDGSWALVRIFQNEKFNNYDYDERQSLLKCWY